MFSIQRWSRFSPRKFIILLCVFYLWIQSEKKQQVSLHFPAVLPHFFFVLKRSTLKDSLSKPRDCLVPQTADKCQLVLILVLVRGSQ